MDHHRLLVRSVMSNYSSINGADIFSSANLWANHNMNDGVDRYGPELFDGHSLIR